MFRRVAACEQSRQYERPWQRQSGFHSSPLAGAAPEINLARKLRVLLPPVCSGIHPMLPFAGRGGTRAKELLVSRGVCGFMASCWQLGRGSRLPRAKPVQSALKWVLIIGAGFGFGPADRAALAQTWTQTTAPTSCWFSIASSADGRRLIAVDMERIWISNHAGTTWTPTDSPSNNWYRVSSSADGTKLAAGVGFLVRGPNNRLSTRRGPHTPRCALPEFAVTDSEFDPCR